MFGHKCLYGLYTTDENTNENVLFKGTRSISSLNDITLLSYDNYKKEILKFIYRFIITKDNEKIENSESDFIVTFLTQDEAEKVRVNINSRFKQKFEVVVIDIEEFLEDVTVNVFMSHPMSGLSFDDVKKLREYHYKQIVKHFGNEKFVRIIDNYEHESVPENAGRLWHLGTSVTQMEEADYIYFCDRIPTAKGVMIEREIARIYGLKVLNDEMGYIKDEESKPKTHEDENMTTDNSTINIFTSPYQEMSELIGEDVTMKLFDFFKGRQITFPQRIYTTEHVTQYVKAHYTGKNLKELADKFNYSERRIREFLKVEDAKVEKGLTRDTSNVNSSVVGNSSIKNNIEVDRPMLDSNALYYLNPFLSCFMTVITEEDEDRKYLVHDACTGKTELVCEYDLMRMFQDYTKQRYYYNRYMLPCTIEEYGNLMINVRISSDDEKFTIGHMSVKNIIKPYVPMEYYHMI